MRKLILTGFVAAAVLVGQAGVAQAADVTVTANVTAGGIGLRSLTSTPAIALVPTPGVSTVQGTMTAVVTEAAVTGTTPWSVTATMTALSKSGATDIANTNLAVSNRATVQAAGGGSSTNPSGSQDLSASRTIHTTTGQSTTAVYTGLYTDTANLDLAVPNGQPTGIYTGTMTITLNQ
jgi:hypothetical protein